VFRVEDLGLEGFGLCLNLPVHQAKGGSEVRIALAYIRTFSKVSALIFLLHRATIELPFQNTDLGGSFRYSRSLLTL
jgi:hypothetical protein